MGDFGRTTTVTVKRPEGAFPIGACPPKAGFSLPGRMERGCAAALGLLLLDAMGRASGWSLNLRAPP